MNQSCCLIWSLTPGVELNNHVQNIQEKQIYEQLDNTYNHSSWAALLAEKQTFVFFY